MNHAPYRGIAAVPQIAQTASVNKAPRRLPQTRRVFGSMRLNLDNAKPENNLSGLEIRRKLLKIR